MLGQRTYRKGNADRRETRVRKKKKEKKRKPNMRK